MIRNPACELCTFGHPPVGAPPTNVCLMARLKPCDVMVVAEIPSGDDDRFKALFSSKILSAVRAMFEQAGIDVHVTYAVKCKRPDRTGRKQAKVVKNTHVKTCAESYLRPEIAMVRPRHIVVLGANAHYAATKNPSFAPNQGQRYARTIHFPEQRLKDGTVLPELDEEVWIYPTYSEALAAFKPEVRQALWGELRMFIDMIQGAYRDFKPPVRIVDTLAGLREVQAAIRAAGGRVAADTETGGPTVDGKRFNGLQMFKPGGWVRCIQFCWNAEEGGVFVPLGLAYEGDLIEGYDTVQVEKQRRVKLDEEELASGRYGKAKTRVEKYTVEERVPIPQAVRYWSQDETLEEAVEIVAEILREFYTDWWNGKFDRKWMWVFGMLVRKRPIRVSKLGMDGMNGAHVLDENRESFKLKRVQVQELGIASHEIKDKMTKDLSQLIPYATIDTVTLRMIVDKFEAKLDEPENWKLKRLHSKVVKKMDRIYTEMEIEGWPVALSVCVQKRKIVKKAIRELLAKLDDYLLANGVAFDPEPEEVEAAMEGKGRLVLPKRYGGKRLGEIVFDELQMPMSSNPELAYTDEGDRATSVQAFLHIRNTEFISTLLRYKKAVKILTTYIRPMIQQAKYRGKLTTSYRQTIATARSGSGKEDSGVTKGDEMNLQNLGYTFGVKDCIRFEIGDVNPLTGKRQVLISCDFSQIELRAVAEFSGDRLMVWAYDNEVDLHTYRAIRNMGLDRERLDGGLSIENWHWVLAHGEWSLLTAKEQKEKRKRAKPVSFGYVYGMGAKKFQTYAAQSYDIDFSMEEASDSRDLYFRDHAGLQRWYKRVEASVNKLGYVESYTGRRRRLPILKGGLGPNASKERKGAYSAALRQAVNCGPQEFGGWLKYAALIEFRKRMKERKWWGRRMMVFGEVHDSVSWWADEDVAVETGRMMVEIMRHPPLLDEFEIDLRVPIDAECEIGASYGSGVVLGDLEKTAERLGLAVETCPYWLSEYCNAFEKAKDVNTKAKEKGEPGLGDPHEYAMREAGEVTLA